METFLSKMKIHAEISTPVHVCVALFLLSCLAIGETQTKRIAFITDLPENLADKVMMAGANEEAERLNKESGKPLISVEWLRARDLPEMASMIDALAAAHVDGIAVRTREIRPLAPAINSADERMIYVAIIDRDTGETKDIKCLVVITTENKTRGKLVMRELIHALGSEPQCTTMEIFGGDPSQMRDRVTGAIEEASAHNIELKDGRDVVWCTHSENALDIVKTAWQNRPEICAWAMVSGWQIFSQKNAFYWAPQNMFFVAYDDFIDDELEYVRSGRVKVLFVDDFHKWGIQAVDSIYEAILSGKKPAKRFIEIQPTKVTLETIGRFADDWHRWAR